VGALTAKASLWVPVSSTRRLVWRSSEEAFGVDEGKISSLRLWKMSRGALMRAIYERCRIYFYNEPHGKERKHFLATSAMM